MFFSLFLHQRVTLVAGDTCFWLLGLGLGHYLWFLVQKIVDRLKRIIFRLFPTQESYALELTTIEVEFSANQCFPFRKLKLLHSAFLDIFILFVDSIDGANGKN